MKLYFESKWELIAHVQGLQLEDMASELEAKATKKRAKKNAPKRIKQGHTKNGNEKVSSRVSRDAVKALA